MYTGKHSLTPDSQTRILRFGGALYGLGEDGSVELARLDYMPSAIIL